MDDRVAITLLRHGMTADNERSAYIGWSNPPLSEKGRKGVQKVNDQLIGNRIEYVFSSDLKRCMETAAILFPNYTIQVVRELREMHFGVWERKTYEELKHLKSYQNWLDSPFELGPDGGETFVEFANRIKVGFENIKKQILDASFKEIAIVTHGGVIRFLLTTLMKSDNTFFDWKTPYGSGYRLSWNAFEFRRGEACMLLQEVPITERQHG